MDTSRMQMLTRMEEHDSLPRLAAPNEDTSCSISPRSSSPRSSSPGSAFHVASRGKERDYPSDGHLAGYGGFVPTSQNHFGTSFGLTTQSARSPNKPLSPSRRASNNGSISPRTNVPGYGGNCKGSRFKFANTFGNTVAELERDAADARHHPTGSRLAHGDLSHGDGHIPGYAGFIRSGMHYFGSTYGEASRSALNGGERFREGPELAEDEDLTLKKRLPMGGHRPGYTGFISGAQDDFGQSFHTITAKASDKFQATTRPGER